MLHITFSQINISVRNVKRIDVTDFFHFFAFLWSCFCQADFKAKSVKQDKAVVYQYINIQSTMKI